MILTAIGKSELFMRAMREAQSYKHSMQMLARRDLGDEPIKEWFKTKWSAWYRERWLEHLCGRCRWKEFGEEDFDLISNRQFQPNIELVLRIIDNLKKHRDNISENLGMILCAAKNGDKELSEVMIVLQRLDINSKRPCFDECRVVNFYRAIEEADRYKYIESQKAKCDLGDQTVKEWFERFWPDFAKDHGLSEDSI